MRVQNTETDMCSVCVCKRPEETVGICPTCKNQTLHFTGYGSACFCTICGYGWATTPDFPI